MGLFNKLVAGFLMLAVSACVVGCSGVNGEELHPGGSSSSVEVVVDVPEEDSAAVESCFLDAGFMDKLKGYANSYTYVRSEQDMQSFRVEGGVPVDSRQVFSVVSEADTKNKVMLTEITSKGVSDADRTISLADDFAKGVHVSRRPEDLGYTESAALNATTGVTEAGLADVWSYILAMSKDSIPLNSTCYFEDGIHTFTIVRGAVETDLTGAEYDKLGTTTLVFTAKDLGDGVVAPESISMQTTYFIGQVEYGVSTKCTFTDFSSRALSAPLPVAGE